MRANPFTRAAAVLLLVVATLAGCGADPAWSPPGTRDERMVRTELYFGLNRPDGTQVTEDQRRS
jgi:hypothetical protein